VLLALLDHDTTDNIYLDLRPAFGPSRVSGPAASSPTPPSNPVSSDVRQSVGRYSAYSWLCTL
jgi:hypothetical protein